MLSLRYALPALVLIFSCTNNRQQEKDPAAAVPAIAEDSLVALPVTVVADLPDSLQPKTILLENMPKPLSVVVPTNTGGPVLPGRPAPPVITQPPVLTNDKGEVIKDENSQPFVLGDGGVSNFTLYTSDDGLALDDILSSCPDQFGNLWFGTDGAGVSRYDGKTFTSFSTNQGLAHNSVLAILEDRKSNLWFATGGGGVSRYDGRKFTTFTTKEGLANNTVLSIAEDKNGNLWFGTHGGGASRYDGKQFTTFTTKEGLADNIVWSIAEDKSGNLWFGTRGGGASRYDGKTFTTFTTKEGLAEDKIYAIFQDRRGTLWFGTGGGGISRYDGTTFMNYTTSQGLAHNYVRSIFEDVQGNLWFSTRGGGVSRYDGKTFTSFTTSQGLPDNKVLTIAEDQSGNLWFGTVSGGISRYDGKDFTSFTTRQGMADNKVLSIAEDKNGNLWFGTVSSGVSRYDGRTFTTYGTSQGLAGNSVAAIAEDNRGNLWFSTNGEGVSRFDGTTFTTYTTAQGLPDNIIRSALHDSRGNLWLGTQANGVIRYDGTSFTTFTAAQGLAGNKILSITKDRSENLWFGTGGEGVSRYDGKTFITFTTAHGLANDVVRSILEDTLGNLWFGTYGGGVSMLSTKAQASLFRNPGEAPAAASRNLFKNLTTADGLPDNFITQLAEGKEGLLYAGTNLGFCEIAFADGQWAVGQVFNSLTGYPVKDVNIGQNALFKDRNGHIWIGTGSNKTALVCFDPQAVRKSRKPPKVIVRNVRIGEVAVPWYSLRHAQATDSATIAQQELIQMGKVLSEQERDSLNLRYAGVRFDSIPPFYPLPENLILPYQHNSVGFDFVALETGVNFSVRYQYILEGYNHKWSPETDKTSAVFGNIREGTYAFRVKAKSREGIWSEPVSYTFRVLPPWYRTWWAYTLFTLMFLFALYLFTKWRERELLARQKVLERTVELRTAELVAEKKEVEKQKEVAEREKQRSDELLLNILPEEVAEELKVKGSSEARQFDEVTVMFTDFKGFTQISEKLSPAELVAEIHHFFKAFDEIITKYDIEKIKTIGDSYMCAGGLPVTNKTNALDVVRAALEIQEFMQAHLQDCIKNNKVPFEIRIGVHTGPVVAGIVGVKKFAYDIWGDTVNIASRMESSGEAGKVNISGSTYQLVKEVCACSHRGKIEAKGKGEIDMYYVEGLKTT